MTVLELGRPVCPGVKLGLDLQGHRWGPFTLRSQPSLQQPGRKLRGSVPLCLSGPVTWTKLQSQDSSPPPIPYRDRLGEVGAGQGAVG